MEISPDMNLEQIIELVSEELVINDDNISHESTRQVKIFSKLQQLYVWNTRKLEKCINEMAQVKVSRYRFYTGKLPAEHYKKEPLRESILKSDVDSYMSIDPVVVEMKNRLAEQERIVKFLEDAKKQLNERAYLLRTALDFQKMNLGF